MKFETVNTGDRRMIRSIASKQKDEYCQDLWIYYLSDYHKGEPEEYEIDLEIERLNEIKN